MINFALIQRFLPDLLSGLAITLQIGLWGSLIGMLLGTICGLVQASKNRLANILVGLYVYPVRGTPMLIQIIFIYNLLPLLGIYMSAFWTAVTAIGLNSGAYVSNVVRSGITSVGRGQLEAAKVLGLSRAQTTWYIVLPQAVRVVLPALGNELVTLVKDSSLASFIGVMELSKVGNYIESRTYDSITAYVAVALFYLLVTSLLSVGVHYLERRMNSHAQH